MSQTSANADTHRQCRLAEIVQFNCNPTEDSVEWHCLPIIRIFRICQNKPAVELTRFIEMDVETGAVHVPPQSSQVLPKGKLWRDVIRYEQDAPDIP
ncbi:hypothetical protein GY45DRAFT_1237731 [Cubamyces sp. BRFM 1775]|nr:hypothetical protein GY45DRAFT_1237731 [Cubamyces sp. BRFM 1775]